MCMKSHRITFHLQEALTAEEILHTYKVTMCQHVPVLLVLGWQKHTSKTGVSYLTPKRLEGSTRGLVMAMIINGFKMELFKFI